MQPAHDDAVRKIAEMIKGIRTAMLVTNTEGGVPRSRPMSTQDVDFDGTVWFFTGVDTRKAQEIARNPTVAVTYASSGKETYVSLTGRAELVDDRARIREYWNPFLKAWFDAPDDPSLRLLKVDISEAEYWANEIRKKGYMIYSIGLGNPYAKSEEEKPDLDFLRRVANEKGIVSVTQPKGELMFAPTAADLDAVFRKVADRILTRLTH